MRKILITGGKGFLGRNLTEYLSPKYQVFSPSHNDLDLLDSEKVLDFLKKNKIDIVLHCANIGGTRNTVKLTDVASINLRMFINLLLAKKYFQKMIFFGSGAQYDRINGVVKVKETDEDLPIPKDEYGLYKYIASQFIKNEKTVINLRLFGVYGKYEDALIRFVSNIITQMLTKKEIVINRNRRMDYLYVNDFVKITDHFLTHETKYRDYNIGRGVELDLVTIAKLILKVGKNSKKKIKISQKGYDPEYTCNIDRLKEEMPGFKYTPWEKAIEEMIRYYRTCHCEDPDLVGRRGNPARMCANKLRDSSPSTSSGSE